jgi:hypothetical protein
LGFQIELCCRYFGFFWLGDSSGYLKKLGEFFSNLLVTLKATTLEHGDQIDLEKIHPFFEK